MRTFEQIEKDLNNIRREIKEGIVETLKSKGYDINQTAYGREFCLQMFYDEDHTCFCPTEEMTYDTDCWGQWRHIDFATLDQLMELYATALRATPR